MEDESHNERTDETAPIPKNKSSNYSGSSDPTQENMRGLIREALKECEERELRRLKDYNCWIVVLTSFEEAHECAELNVYTTIVEVLEQADVKDLITWGDDELLNDKTYERAESLDITQGFVSHVTK